ncbi:YceI family protein [Ahrensia sp. R2A130]|uniref:YceI family protein n=1 Tax=Ahrensia sp. R2A130 TaxID=744979 RepID=UPI0001E0949F|nr:YceI family protein [Ahrensia sp. R2A130]EFL88355.1 protein YceI [Ahrensia sp. R2A130]
MKRILLAASIALATATSAFAADSYKIDPSHAQAVFSYNHLGFSTTYGMFSGFTGTATLDTENLANSSVQVEMKLEDMLTGWQGRDDHFKSPDFFNAGKFPVVTFTSTSVEPTGDKTAKITGDLKILGQTKSVTLDATVNKVGTNPINQKGWAGFDATTTLKRTDWGLGKFAPNVSDEVEIIISAELEKTS